MPFLFIDQYNYNQPPLSIKGSHLRKHVTPQIPFWILGAVLFGEKNEKINSCVNF